MYRTITATFVFVAVYHTYLNHAPPTLYYHPVYLLMCFLVVIFIIRSYFLCILFKMKHTPSSPSTLEISRERNGCKQSWRHLNFCAWLLCIKVWIKSKRFLRNSALLMSHYPKSVENACTENDRHPRIRRPIFTDLGLRSAA